MICQQVLPSNIAGPHEALRLIVGVTIADTQITTLGGASNDCTHSPARSSVRGIPADQVILARLDRAGERSDARQYSSPPVESRRRRPEDDLLPRFRQSGW